MWEKGNLNSKNINQSKSKKKKNNNNNNHGLEPEKRLLLSLIRADIKV